MGRDVVIVGGGVMGLSIALCLAREGCGVVLLERNHLGSGSTGKSGAILRQHYSLPLTATMARESLDVFSNFEEWTEGGSAGFVRSGMVLLVGPDDVANLNRNLELQRLVGIRTELVDNADISRILPHVEPGDSVACYEEDAGYADPVMTVHTLAKCVRGLGVEIHEGLEVTGFVVTDSKVTGVSTSEGEYSAQTVVVAAGAWADALLKDVGWSSSVQPMRVQSAVFRRPPELPGGPTVIDFPNEMYAKQAGETHVGSILPSEASPTDPDAYDEGVEGRYVRLALGRVSARFPAMSQSISFGGYGALYAVTPDWHPVVGEVGLEGLYLCAGFSGHGFKLAPSIAATVAAEVVGKKPPHDFAILRPDRFATGTHIETRYAYSILG